MLKNFLFDITGLTGTFTIQGREQECINYIKQTVGNNKVLVCEVAWILFYLVSLDGRCVLNYANFTFYYFYTVACQWWC